MANQRTFFPHRTALNLMVIERSFSFSCNGIWNIHVYSVYDLFDLPLSMYHFFTPLCSVRGVKNPIINIAGILDVADLPSPVGWSSNSIGENNMQETLCRMAMVRQNMFEAAAFPLNQPFFWLRCMSLPSYHDIPTLGSSLGVTLVNIDYTR